MIQRNLSRLLVLATFGLVAGTASPADAQIREIAAGQTVTGRITSADPVLGDGSHYHMYVYRGRAGEQISVVMRSTDFDAFLSGGRMEGGALVVEVFDDDGAGGTDARLDATVGRDGTYHIRANTLEGGETGAYTLRVDRSSAAAPAPNGGTPPPAAGDVRRIAMGQTVSGRLAASDPVLGDGSHYHMYLYQGQQGERITVTLRSGDFDAFLSGGSADADSFEDSDDDGAGGTDARLVATVGRSGAYLIRVNSLEGGETGAYTLTVERASAQAAGPSTEAPPAPATGAGEVRNIAMGETATGRLSTADPAFNDGTHFHTYVYRGRPGDHAVVTLRSADFDAMLLGGHVVNGEWVDDTRDDDGAGGTDSRLRFTVGPSGVYGLRANTYGSGETGAYTLSLQPINPINPDGLAGPRTIRAGQTVSGTLGPSDPRLPDNSHYHAYVYEGQPGDEVVVTLRSSDFDAYLRWGKMDGGVFEGIMEDDDGAGGTDARLTAFVDGAGRYVIQANTLTGGERGEYTLSVDAAEPTASSARTLRMGQTARGRLETTAPVLGDGSHYDFWLYRGRPGERVVVTMRSTEFDTYLRGGRPLGGGRIEAEASDDDSGGGTDARIVGMVGPSGTYAVQANSLGAGMTGAYTLTVEPVDVLLRERPSPPPGVRLLEPGASVQDALTTASQKLDDDSHYAQYAFTGQPGERFRVTLRSSDFDAFLFWGRLDSNGNFFSEAADDDGAGGTDAQLDVTVGAAGLYAIRANTFEAGETGRFTLTVEPLGAASQAERGGTGQGKWIPNYVDSNRPEFRAIGQRLKQQQYLETLTDGLNQRFPIPRNLSVRLEECGEDNAYYRSHDASLVLCYEFVQRLASLYVPDGRWTPEQRETVDGATTFVMMHEVGHALVDVLDLPITGREEDAVDQLAAYMLIQGGDKGAWSAMNGVLALQTGERQVAEWRLAGEHSLDTQRLYNVACWIYGSDPLRYEVMVTNGLLPPRRAARCPAEYEQLSKAWTRLLQPHVQQ
jgi:hypothetical protein